MHPRLHLSGAIAMALWAASAPAAAQRLETRAEHELRTRNEDHTAAAYGISLGLAVASAALGGGVWAAEPRTAYGPILTIGLGAASLVTFFVALGMDAGAMMWSGAPAGRDGAEARAALSRTITILYGTSVLPLLVGGGLVLLSATQGDRFSGGIVAGLCVMPLAIPVFFTALGLDITAGRWAPAQWIVSPTDGGAYVGVTQPF